MSETWQALEARLDIRGPQPRGLPQEIVADHVRLLSLRPPVAARDLMPDPMDRAFGYDVALARERIAGGMAVAETAFRTSYAAKVWGVREAAGLVRQGEGSNLDLIWVLRMPLERLDDPVLLFVIAEEVRLLDGSHRVARAHLEGLEAVRALVIPAAEALRLRKPWPSGG